MGGNGSFLQLCLGSKRSPGLKVLCLGSHADDIEIGCGGTLLRLMQDYKRCQFHWVVFSAEGERSAEARKSAAYFLRDATKKNLIIKDFRTSFFPSQGAQIKQYFEDLKENFDPDVIFTHYRNDLHQDHHLVAELTWNTFRNHLILEYEIPKFDGDLANPNFFVYLNEPIVRRKMKYILASFQTQKPKHWFSEDTFRAVLRLRGIESAAPEKYAEAFYCRKVVL
jgi:LmbE family N-acetylglucosaminyl deacetylase